MPEHELSFSPPEHEAKVFVLSGLSGSGKDSVLKELKKQDLQLHFVITATTRKTKAGGDRWD